jgi:hypothetical protein
MYNPCSFDYFKSPDKTGETADIEQVLKIAFEKIYNEENRTSNPKLKIYENFEKQDFFQKIIENYSNS